jgi:Fe2+ or Zn2+ uptake regulation protein
MAVEKDDALELLRENGLKATTQRLAILGVLMDRREHPTAEEVHERLREEHPTISLSTVYDTLARLSEIGIVDPLHIGDGVTRYEFHNHPHVNVVCTGCEGIVDVDSEAIEPFLEDLQQETGFRLPEQQITLEGRCEDCRDDTG